MVSDVEYLFMCLFVIFGEMSLHVLCPFLIGFFFFFIAFWEFFVYFMFSSDMWPTNILSKYIVYSLSFILTEHSAEQKFLILKKSNVLIF